MTQLQRPGVAVASRPLHFIWIADCSQSMATDGKIQAVNFAIQEALAPIRDVAAKNPWASVLMRAVRFSTGAQWHIADPRPVETFAWPELSADGVTDMGQALTLVADQLKVAAATERCLPPVLVLLSDGDATDDFQSGLAALMAQPLGRKAVRLAVAIGKDARLDTLQKFIGHPEVRPLEANNPAGLAAAIKWVSTSGITQSSLVPGQRSVVPKPIVTTDSAVW